jgi:hypothetical protein
MMSASVDRSKDPLNGLELVPNAADYRGPRCFEAQIFGILVYYWEELVTTGDHGQFRLPFQAPIARRTDCPDLVCHELNPVTRSDLLSEEDRFSGHPQ